MTCAEPDDFRLSMVQFQPTRHAPVLGGGDTSPSSWPHGFSDWGEYKQLFVISEDVVVDVVYVEDNDDILGVRDELNRPDDGTLWNTARDRSAFRLFAVNCSYLHPVLQVRVERLELRFFHQKPMTENVE